MTTIKINELPEKTSLKDGDYLIVEDTASSVTTKINSANIKFDSEPFVKINSTTDFPVAVGIDAVSIGTGAQALGDYSISMLGFNNQVNSVSILGDNQGEDGVAIGVNAYNERIAGVALGTLSQCQGDYGTAIGSYAEVYATGAIALGTSAVANAQNAVQIGFNNFQPSVANTIRYQEVIIANAEGLYTPFTTPVNYTPADTDNVTSHLEAIDTALTNAGGGGEPYVEINSTGILPTATGANSITIGVESNNASNESILIGNFVDIEATGTYSSVVTGNFSNIGQNCYYSQLIGSSSTIAAGSNNSTLIASNSVIGIEEKGEPIPSPYSVGVGESINIIGLNNIAIGSGPKCYQGAEDSISIGSFARTNSPSSISIGKNAFSSGESSISIGPESSTGQSQAIVIGTAAFAGGDNGIAIGSSASAGDAGSILPNGISSIAIGENAIARETGSIQLGPGTNFGSNTLKFRDTTIATVNGIITPYTVGQPGFSPENGTLAVGNDGKFYYRSQGTWKTPAGVGSSDSEPYITINPSTAPGALPNVTGIGAIGIGENVIADDLNTIAIGPSARAWFQDCISIGQNIQNNSNGSINIGLNTVNGDGDTTAAFNSVIIGSNANAALINDANQSVVIGNTSNSEANNTISIGNGAITTADSAIQLGTGTNSTVNTIQYLGNRLANVQGLYTSFTSPTNYTPSNTDNVTSHFQAIDTALGIALSSRDPDELVFKTTQSTGFTIVDADHGTNIPVNTTLTITLPDDTVLTKNIEFNVDLDTANQIITYSPSGSATIVSSSTTQSVQHTTVNCRFNRSINTWILRGGLT